MAKTLTTSERLDLLLGLVNDEDPELRAGYWRGQLSRFVGSFDGSESAGFVRATVGPGEQLPSHLRTPEVEGDTGDETVLPLLRMVLGDVLQRGFTNAESEIGLTAQTSIGTIRFGIERPAPVPVRPRGRERRRLAGRGGTYILCVAGNEFEVVLWLVMHLLTQPGAIVLARCDAPRPNSLERCGRFFIAGGRGRPRDFCTPTCRQRKYWEDDHKVGKGRAAARRRIRRRRQN